MKRPCCTRCLRGGHNRRTCGSGFPYPNQLEDRKKLLPHRTSKKKRLLAFAHGITRGIRKIGRAAKAVLNAPGRLARKIRQNKLKILAATAAINEIPTVQATYRHFYGDLPPMGHIVPRPGETRLGATPSAGPGSWVSDLDLRPDMRVPSDVHDVVFSDPQMFDPSNYEYQDWADKKAIEGMQRAEARGHPTIRAGVRGLQGKRALYKLGYVGKYNHFAGPIPKDDAKNMSGEQWLRRASMIHDAREEYKAEKEGRKLNRPSIWESDLPNYTGSGIRGRRYYRRLKVPQIHHKTPQIKNPECNCYAYFPLHYYLLYYPCNGMHL